MALTGCRPPHRSGYQLPDLAKTLAESEWTHREIHAIDQGRDGRLAVESPCVRLEGWAEISPMS